MNRHRPDTSRSSSKSFNNLIIIVGIAVSIFAFSFISHDPESMYASQKTKISVQIQDASFITEDKSPKTGHNFLASYFLQESSIERKVEQPKEDKLMVRTLNHVRNAFVLWVQGQF